MSLIIDADGEYLSGGGAVLLASGATEFTHAIWVKRNTASAAYQSYAYVGRNPAEEYGSIWLAHNGNGPDCFVIPSGAQYRVNSASGADSTAWQLLVLTYKKDVEAKTYAGITGGSLVTHTLSSPTYAFNADIDEIRIGVGAPIIDGWYPRCKLAHHAFWNKCLSPSEAAELFNGGTAGAGKNPQAVANANLTFYAPLTSDATVSVSGITLSATGTLTYASGDNPNVEAYGSTPTLVIADAAHGHTADNLVLSSAHALTIASAAHGHVVDNLNHSIACVRTPIACMASRTERLCTAANETTSSATSTEYADSSAERTTMR